MAACGLDVFDEKKEVETTDVHSLANVVAFSCKRKQHCYVSRTGSEGLVETDNNNKEVDRRIKIVYTEPKFNFVSYYMLCQFTAIRPNGTKGVGSCSAVRVAVDKGKHFLTCAHNLMDFSRLTRKPHFFTDIFIYKARQGEKKARIIFSGNSEKMRFHPKYNGHPNCGFDIAIVPVIKGKEEVDIDMTQKVWSPRRSANRVDVVWDSINPDSIKEGMTVELAGFPGEKEGWPYTHTGKVRYVTKTDFGGHLIWYDCDATPGNSGSCVMITDKDFLETVGAEKIGARKVIVAVHTGYDEIEHLNYGTLITADIFEWIREGKKIETKIPDKSVFQFKPFLE